MVLILYVIKHKCHYMKVPLKGLHWNVYPTGLCLQTQMLVKIRRNLCLLCTLVTLVINCLNMEGLPLTEILQPWSKCQQVFSQFFLY